MRYKKNLNLPLATTLLFYTLPLQQASAMPTFARSEGVACSSCHTAWPQLNAKGRRYKENGYRFTSAGEEAEDKSFSDYFEDGLPIGSVITARPYDKKKSGDVNNRALHEIEFFVAGNLNKHWSGVFEFEAEDETNFNLEVPWARLSYNHSPALNVNMAWAPYFDADSYGFLSDTFRMTRGRVKVLDTSFGGVDGTLSSTRQGFGLSGRPMEKLFYNVSFNGLGGNVEGTDAKNYMGQLSYDITDHLNVGAFAITGEDGATNQKFTRNGVNFMTDIGNTRLHGAYVQGKDDIINSNGEEKNNALSLQGMHVFKEGKRPNWVPIIRYDQYEKNNGKDDFSEVTLNLTHYFKQNIKGYIEYWKQVDTPVGVTENDRVTAQLSVGF